MECDNLSNEAKLLFILWMQSHSDFDKLQMMLRWFETTGTPLANYQAYNQASDQLNIFLHHCWDLHIQAKRRAQNSRHKDKELNNVGQNQNRMDGSYLEPNNRL